jgi:hypothetical protein
MLIPLVKYNITFLDIIGRPPRVLLYEYFRSFKVFIRPSGYKNLLAVIKRFYKYLLSRNLEICQVCYGSLMAGILS